MFQECKTCPATCTNPGLVCTLQCQRGCGCPPGQLIDVTNNKCVQPILCPNNCAVSLIIADSSTIHLVLFDVIYIVSVVTSHGRSYNYHVCKIAIG